MSIESELLALKNEDGLIVPERAEGWAAAHPKSDLAKRLEWDNGKAGRLYRINQIRQLIVTLEITMGPTTRRFYSLSIDRHNAMGGGYRDIEEIVRSRTLYDILLADALAELNRMRENYERLTELRPLWREVDKIKKKRKEKA
jgi:hypothetical protein